VSVTPSTRGAAVEHYVITRALQHGFRVAVPVVDLDGVDLYLVNTRGELVTVQIKTAKRHREAWRLRLTSSTQHRYAVDVLVAVAPGFEKLWVVPGTVLTDLQHNVALRDKWLDRWDVFEAVGAFRGRAP
jgi:PD-(D/E)XK endonuclease